jgi:FkbM family methyltransferase
MYHFYSLYKQYLPESFRLSFWKVRNFPNSPEFRDKVADLRCWIGTHRSNLNIDKIRLSVDLRDRGVGRPLYKLRRYEPTETAFLSRVLKKGMTFVDVGANIGYFTTLASRIVGVDGKVVGIEPDPENFSLLRKNLATNRMDNAVALNLALGPQSGVAVLNRSAENFGDHRIYGTPRTDEKSIQVRVEQFDFVVKAMELEKVDFIKIDVQGFEHAVQRGMRETVESGDKLTIMTEFWPHGITQSGGSPEVYFQYYLAHGLTASILNRDGSLRAISLEEAFDLLPPFEPQQPDSCYINIVFDR